MANSVAYIMETYKKQGSKLDLYHNKIKSLYNDGKLDSNDIEKLDELKNDTADDYSKGKINKEQYDKLGEEISINYRKIFSKETDGLNNRSENDKINQLSRIKNNIDDAHDEGKINSEYYSNLKNEISILY
jgi:hypothetical protein